MLAQLRRDHPAYLRTNGYEVSMRDADCPYRKCFRLVTEESFNGLSGHLFHDCYCTGFRFDKCPKPIPRPKFVRKEKKNNMIVKWKGEKTRPMTFWVPLYIWLALDGACKRLRCSRTVVLENLIDYLTEENFQAWERRYEESKNEQS